MRKKVYVNPKVNALGVFPNPLNLLVSFSLDNEDEVEGYDDLGEDVG